jgi:hypothetical protein
MRTEIIEILQSKYPEYCMQHIDTADEILRLFSVSLSLLGVAKCPNGNCDNNGTIATQEYPSCEWVPEPCEWCHKKKELLNNEG